MGHLITRKHNAIRTKVFADAVSLKRLSPSDRLPGKSMFARLRDNDAKAKTRACSIQTRCCVKPATFHLTGSECLSRGSDKHPLSVPPKAENTANAGFIHMAAMQIQERPWEQ